MVVVQSTTYETTELLMTGDSAQKRVKENIPKK
jgi:hypothetical protein